MKSILFASMHGSAATEIALLCRRAGVKMYTPIEGSSVIKTLVKLKDGLEKLGVGLLGDEELKDRISDGSIDAVFLSTPGQIKDHRNNIEKFRKLPFVVRHGLNSFDKFKKLGVKNFLSPSPRALDIMSECHCFLNRKLIHWESFENSDTYASDRMGFYSYIHHYDGHWPEAKKRYDRLIGILGDIQKCPIRWYGFDSPYGVVSDLMKMRLSRGTIHIKDGQVVCNAVIRSLAMATPVVMDSLTYENCFFDGIDGILVESDTDGMAGKIRGLMDDEYLEEACENAFLAAKRQFTFDRELGYRFLVFLDTLEL